MSNCKFIHECAFYHDRLDDMPPIADFMKMEFCHKMPSLCARHIYYEAKGMDKTPNDLMPHETNKVKFIESHKSGEPLYS